MGKTISITIPQPLEKELQEEAKIQGVSRSRFICNLLMDWSAKREKSLYYKETEETPRS